jgi:hypothetical protein
VRAKLHAEGGETLAQARAIALDLRALDDERGRVEVAQLRGQSSPDQRRL